MCGIAGFSGGSLGAALDSSLGVLAHRGPDDSGIFLDTGSRIGLGHTRLSIIELSPLGHQPMLSEDGQVVLAFNGEIYNFRELRAELEICGHQFRGHSDTEVLLQLYLHTQRLGGDLKAMLRRLNGIFAFALWDAANRALLLARDGLGVKPLYYGAAEGRFAFASEIKALQPLMATFGGADASAIDRYLTFLWCPGAGTPVRGVRKVGPGEALWIRDGEIEQHMVWYRLPMFRPSPALIGEEEAITGTVAHLRQAVQRQLVADVPVGAFLSGGLDSSSIVAFAREQIPNIRCFTIESAGGQAEGTADDLPYARRVAEHLSVPLEVVRVDAAHMANDLEAMVYQLDEPLADPAPLNVLYISRLAREHGIKVLLSGAGGDDIFTGYRRHQAVQAGRWLNWLPRAVRGTIERAALQLDPQWLLGRRLRKLFDGAALEGDARLVNYFRWVRRDDLHALYTPAFRAALGESIAESPMLDFLAGLPETVEPLQRMLALEQRFFLTDHNLTYTDKMSMAVGVEVRVPFLDLDLVEFASRIPLHMKQRGTTGKWVLKKAMEPFLPREAIYRPKSGFGAPLRRWMRFELRELLGDRLSEASLRGRGIFEPAAVQRLIAANDSGKVDASYTLLSILSIEIWCRRFIDGHVESSQSMRV